MFVNTRRKRPQHAPVCPRRKHVYMPMSHSSEVTYGIPHNTVGWLKPRSTGSRQSAAPALANRGSQPSVRLVHMVAYLTCTYCGLSVANMTRGGRKQSYRLHCQCIEVVYCDKTCQKKDWARHKRHCRYRLLYKEKELPEEITKMVCRFAAKE